VSSNFYVSPPTMLYEMLFDHAQVLSGFDAHKILIKGLRLR
jgi:hypothetical protein